MCVDVGLKRVWDSNTIPASTSEHSPILSLCQSRGYTLQDGSEVAGHSDKNLSVRTNRRRVVDDDLDIRHHTRSEHAAQQIASKLSLALEYQLAWSWHRALHRQSAASIAVSRASTVSHLLGVKLNACELCTTALHCFPLLICLRMTSLSAWRHDLFLWEERSCREPADQNISVPRNHFCGCSETNKKWMTFVWKLERKMVSITG